MNLAAALAARYKILLIDLDPQGNASTGLGVNRATRRTGTYAMLVEGRPLAEVARPTPIPNLSIVPADPDLAGGELELVDLEGREHRLRRALEGVNGYDWVILDCPPLPWLAHPQRPGGRAFRAGAIAGRVLRAGRRLSDHPDD